MIAFCIFCNHNHCEHQDNTILQFLNDHIQRCDMLVQSFQNLFPAFFPFLLLPLNLSNNFINLFTKNMFSYHDFFDFGIEFIDIDLFPFIFLLYIGTDRKIVILFFYFVIGCQPAEILPIFSRGKGINDMINIFRSKSIIVRYLNVFVTCVDEKDIIIDFSLLHHHNGCRNARPKK